MRQIITFWICLILSIGFLFGIIYSNESASANIESEEKTTNIPYDPIHIIGNADFATQAANKGWVGDGSAGNPYIIKGYNIQTNTSHGIHVESTTVHFIIKYSNFTMGTQSNQYHGIYFDTVQNGTIINCNFTQMLAGIYLDNSKNNNISENNFTMNSYGVQLHSSPDNAIVDNIMNLQLYEGIWLSSSESNIILGNDIHGNFGVKLEDSSYTDIVGNTLHDNSHIYAPNNDFISIQENIFTNISTNPIWLVSSKYSSIIDNTITDSGDVNLEYTNNSIISGNKLTNGIFEGISLYDCNNNTISRNEISDHATNGIEISWSSNNTLISNNISYNKKTGILIYWVSNDNVIHHNNLIGNLVHVNTTHSTTWLFDDGHGQGNYWDNYKGKDLDSDGIGDTEIPHEGLDYYPLLNPVNIQTWTESDLYCASIVRNLQKTSGNTYVNLTWDMPIDDGGTVITNYKIYRSISSNTKEVLTTIGAVLNYNDTTVSNGYEYYYKVCAINAIGNGPASEEISVILPPSAPRNVQAIAGLNYVNLTWEPPLYDGGYNITSYTIYWGENPNVTKEYLVNLNDLWFNHTGRDSNKTYYYQISAIGNYGAFGILSNEINVTTPISNTPIVSADFDQDGLLDSWEIQYFGNLTYSSNDDPDNDNYTNLQEFQNGTNPLDSTDFPLTEDDSSTETPGFELNIILIAVLIGLLIFRKKR